jgi:hypothetical protein
MVWAYCVAWVREPEDRKRAVSLRRIQEPRKDSGLARSMRVDEPTPKASPLFQLTFSIAQNMKTDVG